MNNRGDGAEDTTSTVNSQGLELHFIGRDDLLGAVSAAFISFPSPPPGMIKV